MNGNGNPLPDLSGCFPGFVFLSAVGAVSLVWFVLHLVLAAWRLFR